MYNTMRTQKLKDRKKVSAAAAHNFRLRHQGNVDASRSQHNQVLLNSLGADLTRVDGVQEALSAHYTAIGAKENKNSVLAQRVRYLGVSRVFRGMKRPQVDEWAQKQLEFMKTEFGENVKVAVLHLDEKTPHLHFLLSTEKKTLKAYKNQHVSFSRETVSLNANRWNPDFLKGLHDRHAEHNAHYGLKRGKVGSEAVHKPVKDYYRELQRLQARMEGRVNQLEMVPQLVGIIEVLVETIEGLDPPDRSFDTGGQIGGPVEQHPKSKSRAWGRCPQTPTFWKREGADAARATTENGPSGSILVFFRF